MAQQRIQVWMLMRGLGPDASLFFPTLIVKAEEDEPALFGAAVAGFEHRMAAMGYSEDEAARNAIELLREMVDNALRKSRPLTEVLGESVPFVRVPVPVTRANEFFKMWEEIGKEIEEKPDEDETPS
jgi:hypothetical protein